MTNKRVIVINGYTISKANIKAYREKFFDESYPDEYIARAVYNFRKVDSWSPETQNEKELVKYLIQKERKMSKMSIDIR